jgi:hypothetical protein
MSSSAIGNLRALGLCGIDDSVDPELLALVSSSYPFVEWGVLFRPDLVGQPRYASPEWLQTLFQTKERSGGVLKLAGHLCGSHVNTVLSGDASFVKKIASRGFGRVQVNATAINGVNTENLSGSVELFLKAIRDAPEVEWIVQRNEETRPLWEPLEQMKGDLPENVSFLFDSSCGKGVLPSSFPPPTEDNIPCGYAGGIGPTNVFEVLNGVMAVIGSKDRMVWIDMESSLRSTVDGVDTFSVTKSFQCIKETLRYFQKKETN